jgi:hypothetical protein
LIVSPVKALVLLVVLLHELVLELELVLEIFFTTI